MRRHLPRRARRLPLPALLLILAAAAPASAGATHAPGTTFLVNAAPGSLAVLPTAVNDSSLGGGRSISQDGRYVVFVSQADGLSAEDDDRYPNVFRKDRETGAVTLVSRADGPNGAPAQGSVNSPSISDDGSKVAFATTAALSPDDTNTWRDIYLRDVATGTTRLVSRGSGGGPAANDASQEPQISGDGSTVVFATSARNLDPADSSDFYMDVYRWKAGDVALMSRATGVNGGRGIGSSTRPSVSDDGNVVAFQSNASNLAPGDANTMQDVFARVVDTHTTVAVSAPDGQTTPANSVSYVPAVAGDGSGVAFESNATNLVVPGDTNPDRDVYYRTLATSTTQLVSRGRAGKANYSSGPASVSDDGQTIAFRSMATNLDPADPNSTYSAYVWRAATAATEGPELVSRGSGDSGGNAAGAVGFVALTGANAAADQVVVFDIDSGGLTPDSAADDGSAVFARTLAGPRTTTLVSRPEGSAPFVNGGGHATLGGRGAVSADGRYIAFVGRVAAAAPGRRQVFVRDTLTNEVRLVSRADGADGEAANGPSFEAAISADGRRVAFLTAATNLDPADNNASNSAYVRDLESGRTWLASRADGSAGATASGHVSEIAISGDGGRVAFVTWAQNLGDGEVDQVYVRDLAAGRTMLVSRADGGTGAPGDGYSYEPDLNGDGSRVAFTSQAANLGDGDADVGQDVHVRDLAAGRTILASGRADGTKGNSDSWRPTISDDGTRVAFLSISSNLDPSFPVAGNSAFIRDLGGPVRVVAGIGPDTAGSVWSVVLSGDGRSAALVSNAALAPGASGSVGEAFHVDADTGHVTLVSRGDGAAGPAWDRDVDAVALSGDGACVAWDGTPATFTGMSADYSAVFARSIRGECPRVAPETTIDATIALATNRWRVAFSADQPGSTYACSVDGAAPAPCTSPLEIGPLAPGEHTLSVRATNPGGTPDPTPATTTVTAVAPGGPGEPGADRTKPRLDRLAVKPKRVRSGRNAKVGFRLSERATVRATVERLTAGRKQGRRCRATAERGKRCTIARVVWRLPAVKAEAGTARLTLPATLKRKRLAPGSYRISLVATDAAGNRSAVRRAAFSVRR